MEGGGREREEREREIRRSEKRIITNEQQKRVTVKSSNAMTIKIM